MDNIFIGKIVNTHGIKGELRIKSDFEKKAKVFKEGTSLVIRGASYVINSYRKHKEFDMITLDGFNNINDVLFLKGSNVYINREDLSLDDDEYLLVDLLDYNIICNEKHLGIVSDYISGINSLLDVEFLNKHYFIPLNGDFIVSVDKMKKEIIVNERVKELII